MGVCRPDGTFLDANRLAFEGCGFTPAEQVGRPFWDTGWWAGSSRVRERVRRWCTSVGSGGPPVRALTPYWLADGTERLVDLTLHLATGEDGQRYLIPSGLDVTDRIRAERTAAGLSGELQRSVRILDHVADGLYGLAADGRVLFVNPAAARITGHPQEEQLGHDQHALIHARRADGSPYPVEECPVWQALRTGRTVVGSDEVFWHRDGRAVPVEVVAVPTEEAGEVTGVVVTFRDLTARRAAERQAAELQRIREQAAAQRALSDRLQAALLTPPPQPDSLQVAVRYRPAAHDVHVGGDWYDAFLRPDGTLMLVIGDVVGHDSSAAAAMGQLRGLLRTLAYDSDQPPSAVLTRAEHTARGLAVSTLATVLLARLEQAPGQAGRVLRWSSAGHLPPLLLHPDGRTELLHTPADLMLGVDPDARRSDTTVPLPDGTALLLFTDGLVERRDRDLDAGLAVLRATVADLAGRPLEELCETVLERLVPVAGSDDVALLVVRAAPDEGAG